MATSGAMSRKSPSKLGRAANSTMPTTRAMPQIEPMTVAMSMPQTMKGASAFACSAPEHPMTMYREEKQRGDAGEGKERRPAQASLLRRLRFQLVEYLDRSASSIRPDARGKEAVARMPTVLGK